MPACSKWTLESGVKALLVWHLDSFDLNENKALISITGNIPVNPAIMSQNGRCETGLLRTRTLACDVLQKEKKKTNGEAAHSCKNMQGCARMAAGEKVIVCKPN